MGESWPLDCFCKSVIETVIPNACFFSPSYNGIIGFLDGPIYKVSHVFTLALSTRFAVLWQKMLCSCEDEELNSLHVLTAQNVFP